MKKLWILISIFLVLLTSCGNAQENTVAEKPLDQIISTRAVVGTASGVMKEMPDGSLVTTAYKSFADVSMHNRLVRIRPNSKVVFNNDNLIIIMSGSALVDTKLPITIKTSNATFTTSDSLVEINVSKNTNVYVRRGIIVNATGKITVAAGYEARGITSDVSIKPVLTRKQDVVGTLIEPAICGMTKQPYGYLWMTRERTFQVNEDMVMYNHATLDLPQTVGTSTYVATADKLFCVDNAAIIMWVSPITVVTNKMTISNGVISIKGLNGAEYFDAITGKKLEKK